MGRILVLAAVMLAASVLAHPVQWAVGSACAQTASTTPPIDCEALYRQQLEALKRNHQQAEAEARNGFEGEEGRLEDQLARAEKAHKGAVRELHDPNRTQQERCRALREKVLATEKRLGEVTATLKPSLSEADWQSRMKTINALRARSSAQENELNACKAGLKAARVPFGQRQKAMFTRFNARAAAGDALRGLRRRHKEALSALDASHAADLEHLKRQRDYCLKQGVWTGPSGDGLSDSCGCEIRSALALLLELLETRRALAKELREAAFDHEALLEDFIAQLQREVGNRSVGLGDPLMLAGINLAMAFGEYAMDAPERVSVVSRSLHAGKTPDLLGAQRKLPLGTATKALRKGAQKGVKAGAAIGKEAGKAKQKIENNLRKLAGGDGKLVSAFEKVAAKGAAVSELARSIAKIDGWSEAVFAHIDGLDCMRRVCAVTRDYNFSLSAGRTGRRTFVRSAFGEAGPLHRLQLASARGCNACAALKALYELHAHRAEAHAQVARLERLIAENMKTVAALNRGLLQYLRRNKPSEEVAAFYGNDGWNYLAGSIGLSLIAPAAGLGIEIGETGFDAIDAIYARGPARDNARKNLRRVQNYLHENQTHLIYWRSYARSLDGQMEQALRRLMRTCFDGCDKVAGAAREKRETGARREETAKLEGPEGQRNEAPGDRRDEGSVERLVEAIAGALRLSLERRSPLDAGPRAGPGQDGGVKQQENEEAADRPDRDKGRQADSSVQAEAEQASSQEDRIATGEDAAAPGGNDTREDEEKVAALQPETARQAEQVRPFTRAELNARVEQIFREAHRKTVALGTEGSQFAPPAEVNFRTLRVIAHDPAALRAKVKETKAYIETLKAELAARPHPVTKALIFHQGEMAKGVSALADDVERRSVEGAIGEARPE